MILMSGKRIEKLIAGHKWIRNYLTKKWEISKAKYAEDYADILKIYERNSKDYGLPIISLVDIPFVLVRHYNDNSHEAWKALMEKYDVSDEKQESLNDVTNKWNACRINDTSQEPDMRFDELFN